MKTRILFLAAAILMFTQTSAQKAKRVTPRHTVQQAFIDREFITNDKKISIETTDQLDSELRAIEKAWRKYVDDSLASKSPVGIPKEALYQIDAYNYMLSLYSLTGKTQHSQSLDYHLVKKYMLPALTKDVEALKKDVSLQAHSLIWIGSLDNTLSKASLYFHDKEVIDNLYALISDLDRLLKKSQSIDEETAKYSRRLLSSINDYEYDIQAKYFFANKQPDKAIASFITGVSVSQYPPSRIAPFSKVMLAYFTANGEQDKSFAILNNIMYSTSRDQIPRDSLKVWYSAVDSKRGAVLYMRAHQKLGGSLLSSSKVTLKTHPKEWSYLANGLDQDKLQKAKYILVDFWHTGCKPCIEEVPALNEFHEKLKERDDIIFVSINTDHFEGKRDRKFTSGTIRKFDIKFPVVFDDDATSIAKELKVSEYPIKMIMDRNGNILTKVDGSRITLSTFIELLTSTK